MIDLNILKLEVGEVIFNRGEKLFEDLEEKIKFVLFYDSLLCKGIVKNYNCEIRIDNKNNFKNSKCSCQYFQNQGTMCKHLICFAMQIETKIKQIITKKVDFKTIEKNLEQLNSPTMIKDKGPSSVTQITKLIKKLLEENPKLIDVSVEGEISTISPNKSGHMYFTIKDTNALLSCAMFKFHANELTFEPKTGDKVIVKGSISVYEPRGSYQLIVKHMRKSGDGDLYAKFLKLKDKLSNEGLFSEENKKEIPKIPKCIGVVTSPTGAVIRDIINTIKRRFPVVKILIVPTTVQGDGSENSIIEGIRILENKKEVDTIIIARGGGSIEDLWCFNDEKLARIIFNSFKPIISAIGHETDFTICDFVADVRAPTPTAAAEIATPVLSDLLSELNNNNKRLSKSLSRNVERKKENLAYFESDLIGIFSTKIDNFKNSLNTYEEKLKLLSVKSVLSKGYSLTLKDGKALKKAKDLRKGDKIKTILNEGEVESEIQ